MGMHRRPIVAEHLGTKDRIREVGAFGGFQLNLINLIASPEVCSNLVASKLHLASNFSIGESTLR